MRPIGLLRVEDQLGGHVGEAPQLVVGHKFGGGVHVDVADRQNRGRNALFVEVLRIAAAVGLDVTRLQTGGGRWHGRPAELPDGRRQIASP